MLFFPKKKNHDTCCLVCHMVVSLLLLLAALASLVGVIMAHYDPRANMLVFGSNADSLSLIAFVVSMSLWMKSMKHCMGKCDVCSPPAKK